MRVLVTGGSGFVGKELINFLLQSGHYPINVDKNPGETLVEEYVCDLTESIVSVEADCCIHLASAAGGVLFNQNDHVIEYNAKINETVLKMCSKIPIMFISTLNVFEDSPVVDSPSKPITPYAISKWTGERLFFDNCTKINVLRPSNIFGKSQLSHFSKFGESHVIPDILKKIMEDERVEVFGNGLQKRNFLHVSDLCKFIVNKIELGTHGHIFNICSGITLTIKELCFQILNWIKIDKPLYFNDEFMKYEKMHIERILDDLETIGSVKSIGEGLDI